MDEIHDAIGAAERFERHTGLPEQLFGVAIELTGRSFQLSQLEAIALLKGDLTVDQAVALHAEKFKERLSRLLLDNKVPNIKP